MDANHPSKDGLIAILCAGYVPFAKSWMICFEMPPEAATARSWSPKTLRIFEDRPFGQKTTSNPPPDGRMKVEVWSSYAALYVRLSLAVKWGRTSIIQSNMIKKQRSYHNCRRLDISFSQTDYTSLACTRQSCRKIPCSNLTAYCTLRKQKSTDRRLDAVYCRLDTDTHHHLVS